MNPSSKSRRRSSLLSLPKDRERFTTEVSGLFGAEMPVIGDRVHHSNRTNTPLIQLPYYTLCVLSFQPYFLTLGNIITVIDDDHQFLARFKACYFSRKVQDFLFINQCKAILAIVWPLISLPDTRFDICKARDFAFEVWYNMYQKQSMIGQWSQLMSLLEGLEELIEDTFKIASKSDQQLDPKLSKLFEIVLSLYLEKVVSTNHRVPQAIARKFDLLRGKLGGPYITLGPQCFKFFWEFDDQPVIDGRRLKRQYALLQVELDQWDSHKAITKFEIVIRAMYLSSSTRKAVAQSEHDLLNTDRTNSIEAFNFSMELHTRTKTMVCKNVKDYLRRMSGETLEGYRTLFCFMFEHEIEEAKAFLEKIEPGSWERSDELAQSTIQPRLSGADSANATTQEGYWAGSPSTVNSREFVNDRLLSGAGGPSMAAKGSTNRQCNQANQQVKQESGNSIDSFRGLHQMQDESLLPSTYTQTPYSAYNVFCDSSVSLRGTNEASTNRKVLQENQQMSQGSGNLVNPSESLLQTQNESLLPSLYTQTPSTTPIDASSFRTINSHTDMPRYYGLPAEPDSNQSAMNESTTNEAVMSKSTLEESTDTTHGYLSWVSLL